MVLVTRPPPRDTVRPDCLNSYLLWLSRVFTVLSMVTSLPLIVRSLPLVKVVPALVMLSPAVMLTLPLMEPMVLPTSARVCSLLVVFSLLLPLHKSCG